MKIDKFLKLFIAFIPFIIGLMSCFKSINHYDCIIESILMNKSCERTQNILEIINHSMIANTSYVIVLIVLQFFMSIFGFLGIKDMILSLYKNKDNFYLAMKNARIACLFGITICGFVFLNMSYEWFSSATSISKFFLNSKCEIMPMMIILVSYIVLNTEEVEC